MSAILFGSISTVADTSELQRAAFNQAFAEHGLDWTWDRDDYRAMLATSGGRSRVAEYARARGQAVDAQAVHATKSALFQKSLAGAATRAPGCRRDDPAGPCGRGEGRSGHDDRSAVSEFFADLSRLYAADCLEATAALHTAVIAYVAPDRRWRFPADLTPAAIAAAPPLPLSEAVRHIEQLRVDVMLPQMFCLPGMTTYRALFDALGIPYIGNPPDVMALGADKAKARAVVASAGVDVPAGEVLRPGERCGLPPPVVVKPVDADNSLGVSLVRRSEETDAALQEAFAHSDRVLVERYVELGREVRCGIVVRDGMLVCLPLEEYDMHSSPVRRYADKIVRADDGELGLVAKDATRAWTVDPSDPVTEAVWAAARTVPRGVGLQALQPLRLPYRPRRAPLVPGGRPLLLVRPEERRGDDGRGGRDPHRRAVRHVRPAGGRGPHSAYREWVAAET